MDNSFRPQCFDPSQPLTIIEHRLPHWSQAGTLCFMTWRTNDSLPQEVLDRLYMRRNGWLRKHGINPLSRWRWQVEKLPPRQVDEFHEVFDKPWNIELDNCHGQCVLRRPELAKIVGDSLEKFDGDRYLLTDYVVMPNHVHLIAAFFNEEAMLKQATSWKHYTATQINRALSRDGHFWQTEEFDHLIRSPEQYTWLKRYIAENPKKARLREGEYLYYSEK